MPMSPNWFARLRVVGLGLLVLAPALASAQQASGIAGVVRDTSGAVLPGVTVEAASPALIEKVRTVVTDGEGGTTSSICGPARTSSRSACPGSTPSGAKASS